MTETEAVRLYHEAVARLEDALTDAGMEDLAVALFFEVVLRPESIDRLTELVRKGSRRR